MSLGQNRGKVLVFLLIFTLCFLIIPRITFAEVQLSSDEAFVLLRSAISKPTSDSFISTLVYPGSDNIEKQAALMIARNAVQIQSFNFAFVQIPKELLIDFFKKGVFLLSLYGVGFEEVITKLEKESVKEAKKILDKWLNENQVKIASGYINKYNFTSYKGNKQNPVFGYNIIIKSKGNNAESKKTSEVFIEFYSPEFIEPPASRGSSIILGNYWNEEEWVALKKDRVPPFIIRIKGDVEEKYGGYKWLDGTSLEVIFNEPVPEVIIPTFMDMVKEKIKEKINDYLSNPFFNIDIFKAQISETLVDNYGDNNLITLDVYSRLDDIVNSLENQCLNNTCLYKPLQIIKNDISIQDIIDDITEKIDILAQEIAELTGNQITEDEKDDDSEDDDVEDKKKTYTSIESEPAWCQKTESAVPSSDRIIINEVAWMGTSNSSSDEWIELKNIFDEAINLDGWQVLDKEKQIKIYFDSRYIIPAQGFLLLERTDDNSVPFITADYIYVGALSNSGEALELFDKNCVLQDEVSANPEWPAGDSASKRTMERGKDLTWHNYSGIGQFGTMGTPRGENSEPGDVIIEDKILITEIQTAGKTDDKEEFVELYNPNDKDIDLTGWYIQKKTKSGTASYFDKKTSLAGKKISAKGYFLIARAGYSSDSADISVDTALSDDSSLILKNPNEGISDKVGWGEASDYETESAESSEKPEKGKSLARKIIKGEYIDSNNNKFDFEKQDLSPKQENEISSYSIWPMFQHDERHTGRSDFSIGSNLGVAGIYELASLNSDCVSTVNQPMIDGNGVIYYGLGQSGCSVESDWGKVYAINPDGILKWEFDGLSVPPRYISVGIDNTIYISSGEKIYALNSDGTKKWEFTADSGVSAPTASSDGFIYFTSYTNIYCLDEFGNQKWKNSGVYRGGSAGNGPAIGQDGTIYAVWTGFRNMQDEQRGYIIGYNKEDGAVKWQAPLKYEADSPSVGENEDVYAMADDIYNNASQVYVFDQNGVGKNNIYLGHGDLYVPVVDLNGNIIVYDNWSVIAGESWWQPVYEPYSQLKVFNQDGVVLWSSEELASSSIGQQMFLDSQGTIVFSRTIYERYSIDVWSGWWFRAVKKVLVGIDANNGSEKWQTDLPLGSDSAPHARAAK
ncbi:MAG: lamin tail domain-containing protein [Candidatus Nealsonbacteria bacterium]|nr:lamin tail domain-containing protein [Candidatus Nealsonbacteria bacterium]